ncbi:face morphogenesis [Pristimantis euphronides]
MSGLLKRKYEALEDDFTYSSSSSSPSSSATSSGAESDDEFGCSPRPLLSDFTPISILKKAKRAKKNKVQFDRVTVFYFQRCQGFTSVPSRGGSTLGMWRKHSHSRQFTMEEFSREQLHRRQEKLKERLKEEKLVALRNMFTKNGIIESEKANNLSIDDICDEDIDMTNEEMEDGFSPRMYPAKKRRALLRREGVKKIDKSEKHELNDIRKSREECGCDCQDVCEPETCSCNLAGIQCQRDHSTFPCGCTKDGCGNRNGRVEFNSSRVQTHFIHTIMKLELEKKRQSSNNDGNEKTELSLSARLNPFGGSSLESGEGAGGTSPSATTGSAVSTLPYHFSIDLEPASENSCSSDDTRDSSSSSGQSDSSEGLFERTSSSDKSHSDFEEDYLARILHFNDSEYEESSSNCQDNLSFFHSTDFFCDKVYESLYSSEKSVSGLYSSALSNISKCADENANHGADCFMDSEASVAIAPGEPLLKSYMDISLSSETFAIPDDSDYNFGPLYNSLNEYENLCSQQCLVTLLPGFPPVADTAVSFLESLISSSESFGDNHYLEDALKSPSPFESLIA